jgi:hypothetical protein
VAGELSWGPQEITDFVRPDMEDMARESGTRLAYVGEPFADEGNAVVEGITAEGSLVCARFDLMHYYTVVSWG